MFIYQIEVYAAQVEWVVQGQINRILVTSNITEQMFPKVLGF